MVRSKVWAAQEALYDLLAAAPEFAGVHVTYGAPTKEQPENLWVHGQVDDWNAAYRVSGTYAKDETFTLKVSVAVVRLGGDYLPARERVRELSAVVEDLIAADMTLGGTCELATIERAQLEDAMIDERRRAVGITVFVKCRAWLDS